METVKILEKYKNTEQLKELQTVLYGRLTRHAMFGNPVSIGTRNYIEKIADILENEDNFIECYICNKKISPAGIIENFDDNEPVCYECQDDYYMYCQGCSEPVYMEGIEGNDYYAMDSEIFCPACYFKEKENQIGGWKIKDKKIQELSEKNLTVEKWFDIDFTIRGYDFSIESYGGGYRISSWAGNAWFDLTNKTTNILKAIDWTLENILHDNIEKITINN